MSGNDPLRREERFPYTRTVGYSVSRRRVHYLVARMRLLCCSPCLKTVSMRSESLCFGLSDARRSEVHKVRNRESNPLVGNEASNIITIPKNYEIPIFVSKVRRLAMKCPENMLSSPLRLLLRSTSFCSCIFFSYSNPPDAIRPAAYSRPRNTVRPAGARSASGRDTGLAKEPLALRIAPRRAGGSAAALLFKTCYIIVSMLQAPWGVGGF